jgi:hypothetical protein
MTAAETGFNADTLRAAAREKADMMRVFILIGII